MTPGRSEEIKLELYDSPGNARVIRVTGPLTLTNLFDFQTAARNEKTKPIIVDLTEVPYMDSAGLGAVISIFASCQRTGREFGICGVSPRIRTLFQVTHCDGLLPCYESIEAADAALLNS
jgi:anti-sigma B factor antagonist